MLKWGFSVSGQNLTRTDRLVTNADLVGQLQAEFTLDSWWDDYIVIAQFVRDGIADLRVLQNWICDVPDRVLKGAGIVYISLYAVGFETRKTTNEIYIKIEPSGIRQGSLSPNKPSGDVWQQTLAMLNGLKGGQTGQIASKASDNDYDFEFVDLPEIDLPKETFLYTFNFSDLGDLYSCTSEIIETGDNIFPYEIIVKGSLELFRYENGEYISNFDTDFGLESVGGRMTNNGGSLEMMIASASLADLMPVNTFFDYDYNSGVYDYYNIKSDYKFFPSAGVKVNFKHIFPFEHDPEDGWTDTLVTDLMEGKTNGMGDTLTKIAFKIEVPEKKEVTKNVD